MVLAEGWYVDPFEVHDARWFSNGRPTELVRDGDTESHDPPPETKSLFDEASLHRFVSAAPANPNDLRRADQAEAGPAEGIPTDAEILDAGEWGWTNLRE